MSPINRRGRHVGRCFLEQNNIVPRSGNYSDAESLTDTSLLSCKRNKKSPLPFQTTDFFKSLNQIWLSLRLLQLVLQLLLQLVLQLVLQLLRLDLRPSR